MGEIWRARDRDTGRTVAVKRIHSLEANAVARFEREARLLAAIDHPAVVRHLGNGVDAGEPWFAMEWLYGRDLASLLRVKQLSFEDARRVVMRIAGALASVHAQGVIHRDVKPSNIFLVDDDPARATLLDLGIARSTLETSELTATHAVVGSVGYLAPEQARGADDLDARADVFSLGCVLYEAIGGQPPFSGRQPLAVLLKILWDEPARLSSLRAGVPPALAAFVAAMMAKERSRRPSSADEVSHMLATLDLDTPSVAAPALGGERRVASLVVARQTTHAPDAALLAELATRFDATVVPFDGAFTLVGIDMESGAATDRAYRSACLALELRDKLGTTIALATGSGMSSGQITLGPVVDRAVELLGAANERPIVVVDDITEALLAERFQIEREPACHVLAQPRTQASVRTLLGKPTPTVGRERELGILSSLWATCIEERVASAAVVVGGPGMGKSRLRFELEQRIRALTPEVRVLLARADPFAAGSALRLSREIVRVGMGLHDVPDAQIASAVHARAAELCGDEAERVAEILDEVLGVANAAPSPRLVTARQDPTVMRDEVRHAVVAWLRAEAQRAPLLLVLEDLHWGDPGSVDHLDDLLRLREQPVMVLALARPEVRQLFPGLWQRSAPVTVDLGPLSPKAAERLVRAVLGDAVQPALVAKLVARADGNAFFLEELIRFAADGHADEPPETVRAMVQSRFDRLAPELRRIARAASVFGEHVSDLGVSAVLGANSRQALDALAEHEILDRSRRPRRRSVAEYTFRHALIHDAVYAMLTEADRVAAHHAAATWMVAAGDTDALAIAEHFERGGAPSEAIRWLLEAARRASASHDLLSTVDVTKRAIAHGAAGEVRGHLLTLLAEAYSTMWMLGEALAAAEEALTLLPADSIEYTSAATTGFATATFANAEMSARLQAAVPQLLAQLPASAPSERTGFQRFAVESGLWHRGLVDAATDQYARHRARVSPVAESDAYRHWAAICEWSLCAYSIHDLGALRRSCAAVMAARDAHPSPLAHAMSRLMNLGGIGELGAADEFWPERDAARAEFSATGAELGSSWAGYFIERMTHYMGRAIDERAIADIEISTAPINQLFAKLLRAERRFDEGDHAGVTALVGGIEHSGFALPMTHARAILGKIARAEGRHTDVLAHTEAGLALRMGLPSQWAELQALRIEALAALGDHDRRDAAIADAQTRLQQMLAGTTGFDRHHVMALPPYRRLAALF